MAGGPFTRRDQWGHPGLADAIECDLTLRCIRRNREIILAILGSSVNVGVDGDDFVVKNGSAYDLFDDGFYRKRVNIMVEGQPQSGHDTTGYTFNSIP